MGKLLRSLLSSALVASVQGNGFEVVDCNLPSDHATDPFAPALIYRFTESYFQNNLQGQENDGYVHENGYYTKTVPQADLALEFGVNDNGDDIIKLSHTVSLTSSGFQLNQNARISWGQDTLQFQCQYLRDITVDDTMSVPPPDITPGEPIVGTGNIAYEMLVDIPATGVGGTTTVTINPLHSLQVGATLTRCSVTHVDDDGTSHFVHPVHDFKDATVCFDNSRLNFVQTQFSPSLEFTMRTFRFTITGQDSTAVQAQTIACSMHLDSISNVGSDQAPDCDCYIESDCQAPPAPVPFTGKLLILQERNSRLYDLQGDYVDRVTTWGPNTTFRRSCGAYLNGQLYVFGGRGNGLENQISRTDGCTTTRVGDIPFNFNLGGCNTFDFNGTEKVMLCFLMFGARNCHTWDGTDFENLPSTQFNHWGAIAKYQDRPFITLGHDTASTEMLDMSDPNNMQWEYDPANDYPYFGGMIDFATVSSSQAVYVVAGYPTWVVGGYPTRTRVEGNVWGGFGDHYTTNIVKYENGAWSMVGQLQRGIHMHTAILLGNEIHLAGGTPGGWIEIFNIDTGDTRGMTGPPTAWGYPIMMGVADDFTCS